jgi:DNA uptake protein ComE-like DNA-binding protein
MKEDKIIRKMAVIALVSCLFLMLIQMESSPKSPYPMTVTRIEQVVQPIRQAVGEKPKSSAGGMQQSKESGTTSSGTAVQGGGQNQPQSKSETVTQGSASGRVFPMNIHEADKQALMEVEGIGEKRAEQILDYLRKNGPIEDMKELDRIEGIGEVLVGNLSEKFYAGPSAQD